MRALRSLFACALLAVCSAAWADFSGSVVGVIDGDTIDVLVENRPVRVRLAQIDAPERAQAFGTRSRQALSAMVFRQAVTVAEAMIDQGMAWAYRQYVTDRSLIQLEAQARAARRGLWADPAPVEPWLFRRTK